MWLDHFICQLSAIEGLVNIVSAARHLHVEMTSIQNGGNFWLKTNYIAYNFADSNFYRKFKQSYLSSVINSVVAPTTAEI